MISELMNIATIDSVRKSVGTTKNSLQKSFKSLKKMYADRSQSKLNKRSSSATNISKKRRSPNRSREGVNSKFLTFN
jgi:hypothetical protein